MTDIANLAYRAINRAFEPMSIDYPDIAMRAAHAHDRVVGCGARLMVKEPWRITAALYPYIPKCWPVEFKDATDVLADCCRLIAAERRLQGSWVFDFNRLTALLQAESALLTIIDGAN